LEEKGIEYSKVQTKLTHNNEKVVLVAEFFSRTAYKVLEGVDPARAMEEVCTFMGDSWIAKQLNKAMSYLDTDTTEAIIKMGQSCSVEGAFPSTIYLIIKYSGDYERAMIENVMAGGDSAARGLIAGMIIGAYSESSIPKKWLDEMCSLERVNF
jgi:ADP-ribosylglycohydrolase